MLDLLAILTAEQLVQAATNDQFEATIQLNDWKKFGSRPGTIMLVRPAPAAGGYQRVWVRMEMLTPDKLLSGSLGTSASFSSKISLMEADCSEQRFRALQETFYQKNNVQGESGSTEAPAAWAYAVPDSLGDLVVKAACTK